MSAFLGVDAGGTKTAVLVADPAGHVLGAGLSGPGNFQSVGVETAREMVRSAVEQAWSAAGRPPLQAACFGMAGADRPKDYETIRRFLAPVSPAGSFRLVNDAELSLRWGTPDGVGIVLNSGTGFNAIGVNRQGERATVGGLGELFGDYLCDGSSIGRRAIGEAMRAVDGRGPATRLHDLLLDLYGLDRIEDLVERFYHDEERPLAPAEVAPLVFEAAAGGDRVAIDLLHRSGKEMAEAARVLLARLFPGGQAATIVLGGSLFQQHPDSPLLAALRESTAASPHRVEWVVMAAPPACGAVLYAMQDAKKREAPGSVLSPVPEPVRATLAAEARQTLGAMGGRDAS